MLRRVQSAVLLFLIIATITSAFANEEVMVDTVVAIVNGKSITLGQVQVLAEALMRGRVPAEATPEQIAGIRMQYFKMAMQDTINQRLILDQAGKLSITIKDREVEQAMKRDLERSGLGNMETLLSKLNMIRSEFFEQKRDERLYAKIVRAQLFPKVHISPREIREYYDTHLEEYQQEAQIKLSAITFFGESDTEADQKVYAQAELALQELKDGADFAEIAKKYSMDTIHGENGGDWGWIDRESNIAAETAFKLPLNQVSAITKINNSYWILQVTAYKEARTQEVIAVWEDIRRKLELIKLNEQRDAWVEDLRKEANIVYPLSIRDQIPMD